MPSNNTKYGPELRERTAKFIVETGKSATSIAEEMGIDTNTVCKWVRDYRRKNDLPSYAESKGIKAKAPISERELIQRNRELEKELKKRDQIIAEEKEKIEILKKSLRIFMQAQE